MIICSTTISIITERGVLINQSQSEMIVQARACGDLYYKIENDLFLKSSLRKCKFYFILIHIFLISEYLLQKQEFA